MYGLDLLDGSGVMSYVVFRKPDVKYCASRPSSGRPSHMRIFWTKLLTSLTPVKSFLNISSYDDLDVLGSVERI